MYLEIQHDVARHIDDENIDFHLWVNKSLLVGCWPRIPVTFFNAYNRCLVHVSDVNCAMIKIHSNLLPRQEMKSEYIESQTNTSMLLYQEYQNLTWATSDIEVAYHNAQKNLLHSKWDEEGSTHDCSRWLYDLMYKRENCRLILETNLSNNDKHMYKIFHCNNNKKKPHR